jgi:hypothetical protein
MTVLISDIVFYGAANMPEADNLPVGGGVDFTRGITFSDIQPGGTLDVISSSSADDATILSYYGRDPSGAIQNQTVTLNGRSWVTGSQLIERILYAALSGATPNGPVANPGGTPAVGDVVLGSHNCVVPSGSITTDATVHTCQIGSANSSGSTPPLLALQAGDGAIVSPGQILWTKSGTAAYSMRQIIATSGYGTDIVAVNRNWGSAGVPDTTTTYKIVEGILFPIAPNPVRSVTRLFATATADRPAGSSRTFYEKVFIVNNNNWSALTAAQIMINNQAMPSNATLSIALCESPDDTGATATRQTAPGSNVGPFITQPALVRIPGGGTLSAGATPNTAGAQGVWLGLTLPPGVAPFAGEMQMTLLGSTS